MAAKGRRARLLQLPSTQWQAKSSLAMVFQLARRPVRWKGNWSLTAMQPNAA